MSYLICKKCAWEREVSEEDPDSTLTDGFEHLQARHPGANPATLLEESSVSMSPRGVDL